MNHFLQASNLNRLNDVWRNQLRKMILKLLTFLSQHPSTSAPTIDAIFGNDDASKIASDVTKVDDNSGSSVALAATNDVIFYSMLTILKLQPFANPVKKFPFLQVLSLLLGLIDQLPGFRVFLF